VTPDAFIATTVALSVSIRVIGGSIGYSIYYNVFVNKLNAKLALLVGEASSTSNAEEERQKSLRLARLEEIEERLLEFSVGLLTQEIREQQLVSNNLLLYTIGILSIDVEHHSFTRTTTSSSHISGFLWVGRLLPLEYALPKKAHVLLQWPARSAFPQPINRLREVHSCFLVPQQPCMMGELITLKSYARAVQRYDLVAYRLFFSDDLQSVRINTQWLRNSPFKQWIHDSVYKARGQLCELLSGCKVPMLPEVPDLVDSFSNKTPGYSFLTDERNQLEQYIRAFIQSATKLIDSETRQWDRDACKAFIDL
jgi:hypothetical protein